MNQAPWFFMLYQVRTNRDAQRFFEAVRHVIALAQADAVGLVLDRAAG